MDSPYRPGFGARPRVLVGRDTLLSRARATLTRVENAGTPAAGATVYTGARGLGKTVMLGAVEDLAQTRGFATAAVTLDRVSDNIQMLASALASAVRPQTPGRAGRAWLVLLDRLSTLSVEVSAGVVKVVSRAPHESPPPPAAQRETLRDLLVEGARTAVEHGHLGLVVLLDELQEAPKDHLVVLANALQEATSRTDSVPLAVFAAGLPETPEVVMAAASFAERFDWRALGRLDPVEAERALIEPALRSGVHWAPKAVAVVTAAAGGSPYLLQLIGDEAWRTADPDVGQRIEQRDAEAALADVRASLGRGMFRGRWAKSGPLEQALMVAIAEVRGEDEVAHTREITALLHRTTPELSRARQSLIDKGIVEPVGRGQLRFTMPGFAEFVLETVERTRRGSREVEPRPSTQQVEGGNGSDDRRRLPAGRRAPRRDD